MQGSDEKGLIMNTSELLKCTDIVHGMTFTPDSALYHSISSRWAVIERATWKIKDDGRLDASPDFENPDFNHRGNLFWCAPFYPGEENTSRKGHIQMLVLFCFDEIQDRNKLAWEDPKKHEETKA